MSLLEAKELVSKDPEKSLSILNNIINEDPDSDDGMAALFMCAYILLQSGKHGLAYHLYRRCAEVDPNRSTIYSNMGMCVEEDPEKAIELFDQAYKLDPKNTSAIANKALIYLHTGKPKQCINLCEQALKLDPGMRSATHNKGLAKLMLRDWSGWGEYYDTLGVKHREAKDYGVPDWEGQEGTVLVYGEQGVGDEIMFASCLEDLCNTNKVVLDCDRRLKTIFERSFPNISVYGERYTDTLVIEPEDKFDYQLAIGQLPRFFRSKGEYPGKPYLKPDPERVKMWDAIMGDGPRIGISMYGGGPDTQEHLRSTTIETFEPLMGKNLICLDYKNVDEDLMREKGIKYWERGVRKGANLEDTLAIIANLDCVVTVCTTVVYLAGSMGIPCHVLVPDWPGYRYHISGDRFPWYDSVKLHRGNFKKSVREINENIYRIRQTGNSGLSRSMQQYNEAFIEAS